MTRRRLSITTRSTHPLSRLQISNYSSQLILHFLHSPFRLALCFCRSTLRLALQLFRLALHLRRLALGPLSNRLCPLLNLASSSCYNQSVICRHMKKKKKPTGSFQTRQNNVIRNGSIHRLQPILDRLRRILLHRDRRAECPRGLNHDGSTHGHGGPDGSFCKEGHV